MYGLSLTWCLGWVQTATWNIHVWEEIEGVITCMHAFIYAWHWLTGWLVSAVLENNQCTWKSCSLSRLNRPGFVRLLQILLAAVVAQCKFDERLSRLSEGSQHCCVVLQRDASQYLISPCVQYYWLSLSVSRLCCGRVASRARHASCQRVCCFISRPEPARNKHMWMLWHLDMTDMYLWCVLVKALTW